MKNIYKLFNETKINENKYEEVNLTEDEKNNIKYRIKSKIKSKKPNYKKQILVASVPAIILGGLVLSSETTWAYIENIGKQIEYFVRQDTEALRGYKTTVNKTVSEKNIDITLNEIMLEDGELLLSLSLDDSKLDKGSLGIDESGHANFGEPKVQIGDMVFVNTGGAMYSEKSDNDGSDILLKCSLENLDTNGDGKADIENYDLISNMDLNKDYDIKISIDGVEYLLDKEAKDIKSSEAMEVKKSGGGVDLDSEDESYYETSYGTIKGNWQFNTKINGKNIANDIKTYNLDKKINITDENVDIDMYIKELRVSPTKVKIKYTYNVNKNEYKDENNEARHIAFILKDDKGKTIEATGGIYSMYTKVKDDVDSNPMEFEINRDIKSLTITPIINDFNYKNIKTTKFKEEAIHLELNK